MTTNEAAARLGLKQSSMWAYIKAGRIKATKVGRDWDITEEAVAEYQANRKPRGHAKGWRRHN